MPSRVPGHENRHLCHDGPMATGLTVGAYAACSPGDADGAATIVAALAAHPAVAGLEVPQSGRVEAHPGWSRDWAHVITAIPGTMQRIAANPNFGLASPDEAGRAAALAFADDLRCDVATLRAQGHRVQAVELHSGPSGRANAAAMRASMQTISSWDWGQPLVFLLEHGDATTDDHVGEKAFLPFDVELRLVDKAEDPRWRIGINWGRSAVEGRGATLPLRHIEAARDAGLLGALFFSSASGEPSMFGTPWADLHLPPSGLPFSPAGSLLGANEIRVALAAAGDVGILGFKFGLRPATLDADARASQLIQLVDLISRLR